MQGVRFRVKQKMRTARSHDGEDQLTPAQVLNSICAFHPLGALVLTDRSCGDFVSMSLRS